jgi:hypothetical protein
MFSAQAYLLVGSMLPAAKAAEQAKKMINLLCISYQEQNRALHRFTVFIWDGDFTSLIDALIAAYGGQQVEATPPSLPSGKD